MQGTRFTAVGEAARLLSELMGKLELRLAPIDANLRSCLTKCMALRVVSLMHTTCVCCVANQCEFGEQRAKKPGRNASKGRSLMPLSRWTRGRVFRRCIT